MPASHLTKLYSGLSIVVNDISSNVRLTLLASGKDSVRSARGNSVLPYVRDTPRVLVVSSNFYTVLMRLFN